MRSIFS